MTLEQLLAGRNLTAMVQGIKPGLPLVVPSQFLTPTDRVSGHVFEWHEVEGNRQLATVVNQDSPAKRVGHQGVKLRSATMLRSFESQAFSANKLRNIMLPDGSVRDDMGRNFVRQNTEWFKRRLMNLVQTTVQRMLLTFELHFDADGNLLPSSSGATVSISVGIPSGQKGQLNILGGGSIIDASWADPSTDILGHIDEIKRQMLQLGGWEITDAYYGKNIAKYIAGNNEAKAYIAATPSLATQRWESSDIPQGFQGLTWHNASNAWYFDASGTVQQMLGDDEIVFTPSPADTSWWKFAVGSEMVPTEIGQITADGQAMLGNLQEVFGEFSYAAMSYNPVAIEQFVGLNFLPVITATRAVCKADVTP